MSQQAKSSPSTPTQKPQGEKQFKPRGERTPNTQNRPQQEGNQERKSFRGGRGGSRGGARPSMKRNNQKKDAKTVFVGRIFFDDLYSQNISNALAGQLKDQRVRILKDIFTQFGEIDAIEAHVDGDDNNYMLVTYESSDSAKDAIHTFKSKDLLNAEVDKVKAKLSQQKQFPPNVCPELYKYRFDWSDKPAQNAKSAAVQNKNYPKTVVAGTGVAPQQQAQTVSANTTTTATEKPKKERKPKKEQKQQEAATPAVQTEQKPQPKKEHKAPKKQQGSGDLQREAEKAKLKEELKYLQNQQSHVSSELQAEKIRAKERDERISRLSAELQRVREEEQMLQNKLNAENTYRSDGEARIHKLREELSHMHQEEQIVSQKMAIFEQQETAQQNGTY